MGSKADAALETATGLLPGGDGTGSSGLNKVELLLLHLLWFATLQGPLVRLYHDLLI